MKILALVVCTTFFVAAHATLFQYQCIRLDINGTVTVAATNDKTKKTETRVIDLSKVKEIPTGNCSDANAVMMTVPLPINETSWKLEFTKTAADMVMLAQNVTFSPAGFTACGANASLTLSNAAPLTLSSSNSSFLCDSDLAIDFSPKTEGNCSFTITQNITGIQVQAFSLANKTFSPAVHCQADQTTVAPITAPTTMPVPTGKPVTHETFLLKDSKGVVCFRLQAGLQFTVEYETVNKTMEYSKLMTIPGSAKVNGTCASGSSNTSVMIISEGDYELTINETLAKDSASSAIQLSVKLDPANFPKALNANKTVKFDLKKTFEQNATDTFYTCDTEQTLGLKSGKNTSTTLYANNVQMQAFGLKNGSFSGNGFRCELDPKPSPMPPSAKTGDNTYTVRENASVLCIVLTGEISFGNVTYQTKSGSALAVLPVSIPEMNKTAGNVKFSGNCSLEGGKAQQLVVTFNGNWTLALTFALVTSKEDSSMLTAKTSEFVVRDIEFTYYLLPEYFPNATTPYSKVVASEMNTTGDFMKASTKGGSYKCDAQETETLSNGVEFKTSKLQFKAFNTNNSTDFNKDVSECSADDESNSIVPIAVGAALAGLVAIVLIAYLIGRRRSRRQGYESV
ncbi:hypothetical protein ACOMHN_040367 [Nucella lapillus]